MKMKFGWKPSLPKRSIKFASLKDKLTSLPTSVDLSSLCSPVEDQGELGSCVAHGVGAHLEFNELRDLKNKIKSVEEFGSSFIPLSRLFTYANARIIDGTPLTQDDGTTVTSAIKAIQTKGMCPETDWPYNPKMATIKPSSHCYSEAASHKITLDYQLDNTNLNELKECLASGFPFIFGISCYDSMMTDSVYQSGNIPFPATSEQLQGGHCMLCVGYDDESELFKIRNSWGTGFGQGGYGTIPYKYLTDADLAGDFWTLRKAFPTS
jgi:C1A family cysteine protease